MDEIIKKIYCTIISNNLIEANDRVLVGLSGGADSVFLFVALNEIKKKIPFGLACAHVNHGIRGQTADRDQAFCDDICKRYNTIFFTRNINIPEISRVEKISEETCGRNERYKFFREICKKHNYNKIAVAHNMNDSVETIIHNLVRGASLSGLRGIAVKNDDIIRPIIEIQRFEIEEYLKEKNVLFCNDETNSDNKYTRNKIRNVIIPKMKKINPGIINTIHINSKNLSEDVDFFKNYISKLNCYKAGDNFIEINKTIFDNQHIAVKKRILLNCFLMLCGHCSNIEKKHLDILTDDLKSGNIYDMPNDVKINISFDKIIFDRRKKIVSNDVVNIKFIPGEVIKFHETVYVVSEVINKIDNYEDGCIYIDYDKTDKNCLYLKSRECGDKFIPLGMNTNKKVKQFFIEKKIPLERRDFVPILMNKNDIAAIIPYRSSDLYKVTSETKNILKIYLKDNINPD